MNIEWMKREIDEWLIKYFQESNDYNEKIFEAMSYSVNVGGKRIRPILFLLTYNLFKNDYIIQMPIACSLEMIHTYSLIHDDLPCMDNDDLRRGKPTNHKVFGEALAVLAGDALLNEAFNIMLENCKSGNLNVINACSAISNAAGARGMIAGQVLDMMSEEKKISKEELNLIHRKKTGELIKVAIQAGAILGNASNEEVEILTKYGENLGMAFQIQDDILDVIGTEDKLGKNINSDLENHKVTYVTICGVEYCIEKCKELITECLSLLNKLNKDTSSLASLTNFLLVRDY